MKNIIKKILLIVPLFLLGACSNKQIINEQVNQVENASNEFVTYLVLTKNGLYNNQKGQNIEELHLENCIPFYGDAKTDLPNKNEITSSVKDVEFTSWIAYEGDGKPTIHTKVPEQSGLILYAFFTYVGDGGNVTPDPEPDPDPELTTIYFQDASWWNEPAAGTAVYAWNSQDDVKNAEWPGERMTHIKYDETGKFNYWSFELDIAKYDSLIFVRVNGDGELADWGAKTVDLSITDMGTNNMYSIVDSSAIWGDPGVSGTWTTYQGQ